MSSSSDSQSAPSKPSTADTRDSSTSGWRSRQLFTLPAAGSPEFAPALATGALILLLALQAALPYATELPPDSAIAPRRPHAMKPPVLAPYPELANNDVFDPARAKGGSAVAGDDASGGLMAMGAISVGRATEVLLKAPGSPAHLVRAGESFAGWKLVSVGSDFAWVQKGGVKLRLVFGASAAPAAPPPSPAPPSQDPTQ
jgi:hypothetical protein